MSPGDVTLSEISQTQKAAVEESTSMRSLAQADPQAQEGVVVKAGEGEGRSEFGGSRDSVWVNTKSLEVDSGDGCTTR